MNDIERMIVDILFDYCEKPAYRYGELLAKELRAKIKDRFLKQVSKEYVRQCLSDLLHIGLIEFCRVRRFYKRGKLQQSYRFYRLSAKGVMGMEV